MCKYVLVPNSETQKKLWDETIRPDDGEDILHRWLQNFHKENDAEYLFQVQLLENLEDQPASSLFFFCLPSVPLYNILFAHAYIHINQVEYAGKVWDHEKYPFQTVARLIFPKQESFDYTRKSFWEEHIRVDPFLGLESFRPLGGSNRLRRVVYPRSSQLRRKMNAKPEIHVKDIGEIP